MNLLNSSKLISRSLIGAVGLSASVIAFFGSPEIANAKVECGLNEGTEAQGPLWVSECPEGVDVFPNSWAYIDLWLLNPDGSMGEGFWNVELSGPATITRSAGMSMPNGGIIETQIFEVLTGFIPDFGDITLIGTGTGAITDKDVDTVGVPAIANDGRADSYFEVLAQIETPLGIWTAQDPVRVVGDRQLLGVSPDMLPEEDRVYDPNYPAAMVIEDLMMNPDCPTYDPNNQDDVAIAYYGCELINPIFLWDEDDNPVAILHGEVHIVHPHVPEPSAIVPLALFGLAGIWGVKKKQSVK